MQAAQYKCQHSCEHSHLRVSFMALWNLRLRVMPHFHFTLSQILKVSHLGVHRCPQTSRSITRSQSACINLLGLQAKVASNTKANGERHLSKIADHSSLISWISWVNLFLDREEIPCVWKTLNKNLSWMNSQKFQEHLSALSISQHLPTSPNILSAPFCTSQLFSAQSRHRHRHGLVPQDSVCKNGLQRLWLQQKTERFRMETTKKYEKAAKLIRIDQTLNFVRTCWTMPSKCMQNAPNDDCQDPVRRINKQKADFVDSLIPLD